MYNLLKYLCAPNFNQCSFWLLVKQSFFQTASMMSTQKQRIFNVAAKYTPELDCSSNIKAFLYQHAALEHCTMKDCR